ncbi:MAG: ATP-binding protein [Terriglobia bacterium]
MADPEHPGFTWIDLLWLVCLTALAVLPPLREPHKQMILVALGLFQILEGRILGSVTPARRNFLSVLIKLALATLLVWHTGDINSSYYLIFFLPVVTAAMLYDGWATILWAFVTCAAYTAFLIPALRYYSLPTAALAELATRYTFFFLVAVVVNRFVSESRRQSARYRRLAEELAETNRRLQQAQDEARRSERLAALGQLSAGLAHEIRNPLGVIRGSAEMLNERLQLSDGITAELSGYISAEVERLNSLVGRFLDFARPLQPKLERQGIIPIIERALSEVEGRHPVSRPAIERRYGEGLPLLPLDGELAERVFTNLFENAFEAMPQGGVLRVCVRAGESAGRAGALITIEDTGPGVPADQRELIFNPFFTTKKTGVGLGLSIVSKIVDDHHGSIQLGTSSEPGARFRLFFPSAE